MGQTALRSQVDPCAQPQFLRLILLSLTNYYELLHTCQILCLYHNLTDCSRYLLHYMLMSNLLHTQNHSANPLYQ